MTPNAEPQRITGPLKTWYDLHEALTHEVCGLAEMASALRPEDAQRFATRFWDFQRELRRHSEVEDGIMFPAIRARGGTIDPVLEEEHRAEQLATYALGSAVVGANATRTPEAVADLVQPAVELRDALVSHLEREEATALAQVDALFADDDQAAVFRSIIASLPPDGRLQPWVASALTPAHLEVRLRTIASSMGRPALAALMTEIHDGVDRATWSEIEARTPELAALVIP